MNLLRKLLKQLRALLPKLRIVWDYSEVDAILKDRDWQMAGPVQRMLGPLVSERKRALEACHKAQQLQAELDALKAAHAWIKTSERMPDAADGSCCDVLAIIDGTAIVLNYTPDDSVHPWADEFSNIYRADEVTHWQPLPEAPK